MAGNAVKPEIGGDTRFMATGHIGFIDGTHRFSWIKRSCTTSRQRRIHSVGALRNPFPNFSFRGPALTLDGIGGFADLPGRAVIWLGYIYPRRRASPGQRTPPWGVDRSGRGERKISILFSINRLPSVGGLFGLTSDTLMDYNRSVARDVKALDWNRGSVVCSPVWKIP
jgi:hypothetical protein